MDQNNAISKKRILLIEDDTVLSNMYSQKLMFKGYDVLIAGDGEIGLDMAINKDVDLVLTDIMLPRMSGIEFIEQLRKKKAKKDLPIIAWSNLATDEDREKAMRLGVKEYLVKADISLDTIIELINKYVS